jgi:hypothetical protein
MATPVVPSLRSAKTESFTSRRERRLVSKLAIPPSRASIGEVRTSNSHLAWITVKTTSYALRSSCCASCQGKGAT